VSIADSPYSGALLDITRAHEHDLDGRTYGGNFLRRMIHTSTEREACVFNFCEKKSSAQASKMDACRFCAHRVTTL
jgi:hypothetical protein